MNIEDRKWEILLSEEVLDKRISELGKEITKDYMGKPLLIISLLKGSFIFCSDLVRKIDIFKININFMSTSSYGNGEASNGRVKIKADLPIEDLSNYDVLIVDDITDSAHTMSLVVEHLQKRQPRSIKTCVLLDKPSRREVEFTPDYVGFTIEDKFVVGYGFDFCDQYRHVPYIFHVTDEYR